MSMQLPMRSITIDEWRTVPSHRIRERCLKQIVISSQQTLHYRCQVISLRIGDVRQPLDMPSRHKQCFKWPRRPVRHNRDPMVRFHHDALPAANFLAYVVNQHDVVCFPHVSQLLFVFRSGYVGHLIARPDLPMRMRVRATHHRSLVLKDLDPLIFLTELFRLLNPKIHDAANCIH